VEGRFVHKLITAEIPCVHLLVLWLNIPLVRVNVLGKGEQVNGSIQNKTKQNKKSVCRIILYEFLNFRENIIFH
jgi:hypothetical protein